MGVMFAGKPLTVLARSSLHNSNLSRELQLLRFISTSAISVKAAPSTLLPPLSSLPAHVLIRSLLVATISSKKYLLIPALSLMSVLSKPNRPWLFNVDRNPILHGILKKTFYEQFCAGENSIETKATIRELKEMGFRGVIMTYAKETVFDHKSQEQHGMGISALESEQKGEGPDSRALHCASIEAWREGTLKTVDMMEEDDYLAVKLTGAGVKVTEAFAAGELPPKQMLDALDEICERCKERKVRMLVDAESQHFQRGISRVTLELMRKYNCDGYASVYNTYQAYLKSTPSALASHLSAAQQEGFTLGLKLVRGAYMASDERSLIHDTKEDTDNAYNSFAQGALKQSIGDFGVNGSRPFPSVNLFLAGHNKESMVAAYETHQKRVASGLPTVPIRFAQLHGMSDEVSFSLLQMKEGGEMPEVYKCSTWGRMGECLAYLLRRAIENRDAVLRTDNEYRALKNEMFRRLTRPFSFPPTS
ncbi:hypothetical protein N7510_006051 [Penicillium lagena]|uniref:uncharacterized protein n=1 Tax=Penicillium lagena TaxID=94218 RepID=UPI0025406971|nr:uncharacterized protein N7510_006051 [Penicillium lagena]KAJ5612857.1 hypothetical protein N7510_006051 [Penicillium lagena]